MKPATPCTKCGGAPVLNCFDDNGRAIAVCAGWCPACGKMGELCEEPAEAIAKWDAENARPAKQQAMSDETKTEKRCKTCKHFKPATGPSGRVRTTSAGVCAWVIPWPTAWPKAYMQYRQPPRKPYPSGVWANEGATCQTWEAK